ncbi:MAG TPA: potassium channel family protein [Pyrinomonadaceae bacterium]|nr:potassium channel family protein [Pyrinomonadaceae bacterium]
MRIVAAILGLGLILTILWDAFETIILPRRVTRRIRLTSLFYASFWVPWSFVARRIQKPRRREKYLGLFGPLSLLILLGIWAFGLILGYALLLWAANAKLYVLSEVVTFSTYLYLSGVTFFTLGYGDVSPVAPIGRTLAVIETANGFGLFAIVISYLPILYQAFSRREASISLLDARSGSPSSAVELLRRHRVGDNLYNLDRLLGEWEQWSAELLESHLSYPVLCYFRSQHDNQSWLRALTTVLDTCALVMVGVEGGPIWQARMTFAMTRHAVVDIAQVFRTAPTAPESCSGRLSSTELVRVRRILKENGIHFPIDEQADQRLAELRAMYEPYVFALSEWLMMPLPPWILPPDAIDNWKTSAWGRLQ